MKLTTSPLERYNLRAANPILSLFVAITRMSSKLLAHTDTMLVATEASSPFLYTSTGLPCGLKGLA